MVCEKGGGIIGEKLESGEITQWKKISNSENKRQEKKEHIQKAFANVASVEVIPATAANSSADGIILRVAAYCRVSIYKEHPPRVR